MTLLGGFELHVAGAAVELGRQAARVVGLLAVSARPLNRARVAETLWTDSNQDRALSNLRNAVWHLRRADCGTVVSSGAALALDPEVEVDLHRLRAAEVPQPVDLIAEDLLPGWDEEWLVLERERHRQWRLHSLERVSAELRAQGRFADAIDSALLAVQIEPLRESAHMALIAAYVAEGNASEAMRAYRAYAALLQAELGISPATALGDLLGRSSP
ncbi:MAG: BTAD domain-containing putative transcriptional regulator [Acidimicrobiales bacterium]